MSGRSHWRPLKEEDANSYAPESDDNHPGEVNISLDRGIVDAIDTAAAGSNLTRSAFIAEAARNEIQGTDG